MPYKMITLGEKEVARIAGNAGTHAEQMAGNLTVRWRQYVPKEQKVIDVLQLQLCVRDDLHRLRGEIREIERRHLDTLASARFGREVRNVAIPQLRGRLVGIQRLFDGAFGAGSSTLVFGEDTVAIPGDPFPLLRVGHIAHGKLTSPALVLPEVVLEGVKIVPKTLAKSFEPPMTRLEEALQGLEEAVPATNASLAEKLRTLNELQQQAGIAARFLEALYHLAGEPEIARRVRLSSHRGGDQAAVVEAAGEAGDGPAVAAAIEARAGGTDDGRPGAAEEPGSAEVPAPGSARDAVKAAA